MLEVGSAVVDDVMYFVHSTTLVAVALSTTLHLLRVELPQC